MVGSGHESSDFYSPETLRRGLRDPEATQRQLAAAHLMEHPQAELFGDLVERLSDEEPNVVLLAVFALSRLGARAAPEVARVLSDDQPPATRRAAASALAEIGPAGEPVHEPLCRCLEDDDPTLRELAALALSRQGPEISARLEIALRRPRLETQIAAARALGWLGASSRSSAAALEPLLRAEEPELRLNAAVAVANITGDGNSTLPILLSAASSDDARTRSLAAEQLGAIRSPPELAIKALLTLLEDPDAIVVGQAVLGLGRSRDRSPEVLEGLERSLCHVHTKVRKVGLMALASWGSNARDALPAVEGLRGDPDEALARLAAETAQRIISSEDRP